MITKCQKDYHKVKKRSVRNLHTVSYLVENFKTSSSPTKVKKLL